MTTCAQPTLFDQAAQTKDVAQQFRAFHDAHPEVWDAFEKMALKLIRSGRQRHSARDIMQRLRWDSPVGSSAQERRESGGYKINNYFSAYYARMFLDKHPEHSGFFELRKSRAGGVQS